MQVEQQIAKLSNMFSVLGDETRLSIVYLLKNGESSVTQIAKGLNISQSLVSHQLKALKDMQIVKSRRDGKQVIYSLDDEHVFTVIETALEHIKH